MNRIVLSTTFALAAATSFVTRGAEFTENPNRISLGARFGMNFKAGFRNDGPFAPSVNPGPVVGAANHTYNDGYVLVDSSGNAGGLTWNWGYQNASQVVGDTMQFNTIQSSSPSGSSGHEVTSDPQYGAEVTYQRVIGSLPCLGAAHWGLEAAFGYTDLDLRDNRGGTGPVPVTTDTFQLNGVLPPGPGYAGTFLGPGPLLGDLPGRTTTSRTASLTSRRRLSGQIFGIRLGPFAEWNLSRQWSFAASVGLTLAPASVDYDYTESATVAGIGTLAGSGHSSKSALLYGPYASAVFRFDFNQSWGVFVGAQFQHLTDLEQSVGGHSAKLDQGATIYGVVGVACKF